MSGGSLWESPGSMTVPHRQVDFHLLLLKVARRLCSLIVWCQEKYTCVFSVHRNLCEVSAHLQTWDQREEFKLVECVIDFVRTFSGNKFKSIILSIYKYTLYIGYKFDFSFCLGVLSEAPKTVNRRGSGAPCRSCSKMMQSAKTRKKCPGLQTSDKRYITCSPPCYI